MINIYCLHGLLGEPRDWEFLTSVFEGVHFHFVDIYRDFEPSAGFEEFSIKLNTQAKEGETNILIGYSMGGRLGLQALIDRPNLWSNAVFVSTHPGLASERDRASRILQDGVWAMRFLTEEWDVLMERWNQQPVFASSAQMERQERCYKRDLIADAFTQWGLGQQEDFRALIGKLNLPIYWISGANDLKFCQLGKSIKLKHPDSKILEIEQAGHRAPWDNKESFTKLIMTLQLFEPIFSRESEPKKVAKSS